jgi:hypothetical protein
MAMEIVKVSEVLPDYVNFFIDFSRRPVATLTAATPPKPDGTSAISGKLIAYSALGTLLSLVIVQIGRSIGMAPDESAVVKITGELDEKWLPAAALVCIFLAAVAIHLLLLVGGLLAKLMDGISFKGGIAESINATLAFSAWCVPVFSLLIVVIRVIAGSGTTISPLWFLLLVLPFTIAFMVYFGAAFAGAHRLPMSHVGKVFSFAVVAIVLIGNFFD